MQKGLGTVLVLFVALCAGTARADRARAAGSKSDEIARKLILTAAGVREGELVLIEGSPRDLRLLEDMAVAARAAGAFPFLGLNTDRLARRSFDDVPEKYDGQAPKLALEIAGRFDAVVTVSSNEDPGLLKHVDPARLAARTEAFQPVNDLFNKRGVRRIELGNGLYPTAARARQLGLSRTELSRLFWDGVNVDYSAMGAVGDAVKSVFVAGHEVRLTNPNGTDIALRVEGRQVFVSDGLISDEEKKLGGAATLVWLPAGEVYFTPVPGTANGKIVVDRYFFQEQELRGLAFSVAAGKVTSISVRSGGDRFQAFYAASTAGKDELAVLDVGINPRVNAKGGKLLSFVPAGMVTVFLGNNLWAGGKNRSSFGLEGFLPGSTLTVDGKVVVEKGALRVEAATATAAQTKF
jgi:leucyl aminopeptidase (aminopeptidase T)